MREAADISFAEILTTVAVQAGVTEDSICGRAAQGVTAANWPRQRLLLIVRRLRPDLSWRWLGMRMSDRDPRCLTDAMKAAARRYDDCEVAEVTAIAAVLEWLDGPRDLPDANPRAWMKAHRLETQIRGAEVRIAYLRAERDSLGVRA